MKRTQRLMSKAVYLDLSVLQIIKIEVYEFLYDYVKAGYREKNSKIMLHGSRKRIVYIKTKEIYIDIAKDLTLQITT